MEKPLPVPPGLSTNPGLMVLGIGSAATERLRPLAGGIEQTRRS